MPCEVCQEIFFDFLKNLFGAFRRPSLNFWTKYTTISAESQDLFFKKNAQFRGKPKFDFLCNLPIDFLLAVVYNENSAQRDRCWAAGEGIVHFDEKVKFFARSILPQF